MQRHSLSICLELLGLVSPGFVSDHYPSINLVFTELGRLVNLYKTLQANIKDYCSLCMKTVLTYCGSGILIISELLSPLYHVCFFIPQKIILSFGSATILAF